jgi:trk system potassium uptake protein TrkH
MGAFQALLHTMSTVSTGGFGSFSTSLGAYPEASIRIVVLVFMLAGAVSFVSFHALRQRRLRDVLADPQLRLLVGLVVGATILFALVRKGSAALLTDAFHAASAISTTGFGVSECSDWAPEAIVVTILLMFIGGGAGSTAGGLKLFRLLVCLHLVKRLVARVLLPSEAKLAYTYNQSTVSSNEVLAVAGILVANLLFVGGTAIILTAAGAAPIAALFESTSALATVGLSMGITSDALPVGAKLALTLNMWAGRLEILPLLILFYPPMWRRHRRPE